MRKQNTKDTQYKRDIDLRGSSSVGYVHQKKLPGPSFIIIQQMKVYNLQQNPL